MLSCAQVSVSFGDTGHVLENVSLEVMPGRVLGLIGANGSGKSTLARCLSGALVPIEGAFELEGKVVDSADLQSFVGMVHQQPERQLFAKTAFEDVRFGPLNDGCSEREADLRAKKALAAVGLDLDRACVSSPFSYSGGQRRRLALAGVLALQTPYLIMDETDAGLDRVGVEMLARIVRKLASDGRAIVVIGHDLSFVERVSDEIVVLDGGRAVARDDASRIAGNPRLLEEFGLRAPVLAGVIDGLRDTTSLDVDYTGDIEQLAKSVASRCRKGVQR